MKKKTKLLIIILILILLIVILKTTYSKYVGEAEGNVQAQIGQWVIKVNDTDITLPKDDSFSEETPFEITRENFKWEDINNIYGNNIVKGKAAPGIKGEFYIEIDPTQTDTSFKYEIELDINNLKETNLEIEKIELENGKKIEYTEDTENNIIKLSRIKPLSEIKNDTSCKDKIKVKINWPFEKDDEIDTEIGMNAYKIDDIKIPVKVKAIQYTGE